MNSLRLALSVFLVLSTTANSRDRDIEVSTGVSLEEFTGARNIIDDDEALDDSDSDAHSTSHGDELGFSDDDNAEYADDLEELDQSMDDSHDDNTKEILVSSIAHMGRLAKHVCELYQGEVHTIVSANMGRLFARRGRKAKLKKKIAAKAYDTYEEIKKDLTKLYTGITPKALVKDLDEVKSEIVEQAKRCRKLNIILEKRLRQVNDGTSALLPQNTVKLGEKKNSTGSRFKRLRDRFSPRRKARKRQYN